MMNGIYKAARAFANANKVECAKEIVRWRESGIYDGCKLSELASMLSSVDRFRSMRLAEDLVLEVAVYDLSEIKVEKEA